MKLKLNLKILQEQSRPMELTLSVNAIDSIEYLKTKIMEIIPQSTNQSSMQMFIIFAGIYLSSVASNNTIKSYGIKNESFLYCYTISQFPIECQLSNQYYRQQKIILSSEFSMSLIKQIIFCLIGLEPCEQRIALPCKKSPSIVIQLTKITVKLVVMNRFGCCQVNFVDCFPFKSIVDIEIDETPLKSGCFLFDGVILSDQFSLGQQGVRHNCTLYYCDDREKLPLIQQLSASTADSMMTRVLPRMRTGFR